MNAPWSVPPVEFFEAQMLNVGRALMRSRATWFYIGWIGGCWAMALIWGAFR